MQGNDTRAGSLFLATLFFRPLLAFRSAVLDAVGLDERLQPGKPLGVVFDDRSHAVKPVRQVGFELQQPVFLFVQPVFCK